MVRMILFGQLIIGAPHLAAAALTTDPQGIEIVGIHHPPVIIQNLAAQLFVNRPHCLIRQIRHCNLLLDDFTAFEHFRNQ